MVNVADASVWISYFLADDVNHVASTAWIDMIARTREPTLAPRFLILEVTAGIARRYGDAARGLRFGERLRQNSAVTLVSMTDDLIDEATRVGADLRLRGGDAIYVATAVLHGARLVTWDQEQLTRGASLVATATPADDLAAESGDI